MAAQPLDAPGEQIEFEISKYEQPLVDWAKWQHRNRAHYRDDASPRLNRGGYYDLVDGKTLDRSVQIEEALEMPAEVLAVEQELKMLPLAVEHAARNYWFYKQRNKSEVKKEMIRWFAKHGVAKGLRYGEREMQPKVVRAEHVDTWIAVAAVSVYRGFMMRNKNNA